MIKVHNLTKEFEVIKKDKGLVGAVKHIFKPNNQIFTAVDNISFEIKKGEFVGFIGPNGAGKTTTLKMLSGILSPTSGEVKVASYTPWQKKDEFKKKFSLVIGQKNQLWWDLPAIDSYELFKEMYSIPDVLYKKRVRDLSEMLSIEKILDVQVRKLSLGERMKCELLGALIHEPEILFLDEPTIGLDIVSQTNMREFLKRYNKQKEATIILTSHYMEDIRKLCNRMIIINYGKILYDGSFNDFIKKNKGEKVISLTLSEAIDNESLSKFGEVVENNGLEVKLRVGKNEIIEKTGSALRALPVLNISIHEKSLEDCIKDFF